MKWDLFISDALARLLGLLGLIASGLWSVVVIRRLTGTAAEGPWMIPAAMLLLSFAFTLVFLLPKVHDRIVRVTFPIIARLLFIPFAIFGGFGVAFGLLALAAISPIQQDLYAVLAPSLVIGVGVLFGILVFPGGLAYREPKREFIFARSQGINTPSEPRATRITQTNDASVPRKADGWDFLVGAPLGVALIASFYGFKVSSVAQTASYDQWLDENRALGLIVTFAVLWVPVLASLIIRGEAYNPRAPKNKVTRKLLTAISIPLLVFLSFVGTAYDGVPAIWNLIRDHDVGTIRYEIIDISAARRLSDCMTLQVVDQPDRQMFVCNMPETLREGDQIDAIGPLSAYGHAIDQVIIAR